MTYPAPVKQFFIFLGAMFHFICPCRILLHFYTYASQVSPQHLLGAFFIFLKQETCFDRLSLI